MTLYSLPGPPLTEDSAISLLDIKPPLAPSPLASDQPPVLTDASRANELSRTPTPSSIKAKTGLHMQKTLVLDLDETLIHSTSRPLPQQGAGWLSAFSFGRRNKAAGHMVEVVLGGRSTLYHVYKRPFVDYFLRKVRRSVCARPRCPRVNGVLVVVGVDVVYARHLHGVDARVCRSRYRLAGCRTGYSGSPFLSRGASPSLTTETQSRS